MGLINGQLVMLYPNAQDDKDKGDVVVKAQWMVVHDQTIDDMIVCVKDDGNRFHLHTPYEGKMIYVPTRNGKPLMVEKTLFGKYKFPNGKVAK